jgi:hypothetical protein
MDVTVTRPHCALPTLQEVDARLGARYQELFVAHLSTAEKLAAGFHAHPALTTGFAATQAAWRFLNNDAVTLPVLAEPIWDSARRDIPTTCDQWLLVALDWSNLSFNRHASKADRVVLSRHNDLGYELMTALAVSDRDGSPLAPLCLELRAANGVHSTRDTRPLPSGSSLDGLLPVMNHVRDKLAGGPTPLPTPKPTVFIIDRQGDSAGHYRHWSLGEHRFVVRADDLPQVLYQEKKTALGQAADSLKAADAFTFARAVDYQGKPAWQFIAQAPVVLERPATTQRVDKTTGKHIRKTIPGAPLPLRLIVSEIRDEGGTVLARWLLLTNLPESVDAATIALWYYWRWRIESYHKLLKSAGQQIEQWQQQTPEAMARRLAVAAMACVVVWRLARDQHPAAAAMRQVLVRLSGRQIKRGKNRRDFTEPALLAGLGILIPMLLLLEEHDLEELREMTRILLPGVLRKSTPNVGGENV